MNIIGTFVIAEVERNSIPQKVLNYLENNCKEYQDLHNDEHLINIWSIDTEDSEIVEWLNNAQKKCEEFSPDCFYIRLR